MRRNEELGVSSPPCFTLGSGLVGESVAATDTCGLLVAKKVLAGGCGWSWSLAAAYWVAEKLLEGMRRLELAHRTCTGTRCPSVGQVWGHWGG